MAEYTIEPPAAMSYTISPPAGGAAQAPPGDGLSWPEAGSVWDRLSQGFQGKEVSRVGRVGMGMGDAVAGGGQLLARLPLPGRAGRVAAADKTVQEREARYEKLRQQERQAGIDWARLLGTVASPANVGAGVGAALLSRGAGLAGRLGASAGAGAVGGAMDPVASGDFATEKAKQIGIGAGAGLALGGVGEGIAAPFRRSAASRAAAGGRLADFEGQGVTPNIPAIGQGRNVGIAAQVGRLAPFSPVEQGISRNLGEAAGAAEAGAARFGTAGMGGDAAAAAEAGGNIGRNAMRRFAADKSEAAANYGAFWNIMQSAPPAPVTRTLTLLRDVMGKFPSAPELEGLFTSPKLGRLADALEPHTVNVPAKTSPVLGPGGQPIITSPAQTVQRGGSLSVPEMKEITAHVGRMLEHATDVGPDSIPRGEVKRLYAALSADMLGAARQQGPAAVQALSRATSAYNQRMKIIDRLATLTNHDTPDAVFRALNNAASQGSSDVNLLTVAKKTMTADEWSDIGSAIIRRLGNPAPMTARPASAPLNFSVSSFAGNWRRLSDSAKDSFFGADTPGSARAGLEQLYRVANSLSNVTRLGNSHTAERMLLGHGLSAFMGGLASGTLGAAAGTAGLTMGGAWGISKALMSPKITRLIYDLPAITAPAGTPAGARAAVADSLRTLSGVAKVEVGGEVADQRQPRNLPAAPRRPSPHDITPPPGPR